jgi:hypothetical protein
MRLYYFFASFVLLLITTCCVCKEKEVYEEELFREESDFFDEGGISDALTSTDNILDEEAIRTLYFSSEPLLLNHEKPIPMNSDEGKDSIHPCSFLAENCQMELKEHEFVNKYISSDDVVLEVGGRYGTTSCAIAAKQQNSGNLVVVEPDQSVWNDLKANRLSHKCNFVFFHGIISYNATAMKNLIHINEEHRGYGTRFIPSFSSEKDLADRHSASKRRGSVEEKKPVFRDFSPAPSALVGSVFAASPFLQEIKEQKQLLERSRRSSHAYPTIYPLTFHQLQSITQMKFNVLLIDCEGCITSLFPFHDQALKNMHKKHQHHHHHLQDDLSHTLRHVHTIILEGDMAIGAPDCVKDCVDYEKIKERLFEIGFILMEENRDPVFHFINHYVFKKRNI